MILLCVLLAFALGLSLYRHYAQGRELRSLSDSVRARRPFLLEDRPDSTGKAWNELCASANELVTESNRLQAQRSSQIAQLETTLGSLQEAVLIIDAGNYIVLANQALQTIFPKARKVLRERVELILHSRDFLSYVASVRSGSAVPQQEIEFLEGSEALWLEATGTLIPGLDGQQEGWILFVLHDITRQKKLESLRKDFVANVSHELRTPLSIIKGYVETLVDNHRDMPLAEREQFLRTVQKHSERLHALIEDLLILSRLESKNPGLNREIGHLGKVLETIIEDYRTRPNAHSHQIQLHIDPLIPEMMLDPRKISQVFENLLDNALKYTPPGSHIALELHLKGSEVQASVSDNGPGIPAADLPHLFERFYRVDKGRSREKGGTGLGLSIVKHIVQLHGGSVWAESDLGKGTAFHITLPLKHSTSG